MEKIIIDDYGGGNVKEEFIKDLMTLAERYGVNIGFGYDEDWDYDYDDNPYIISIEGHMVVSLKNKEDREKLGREYFYIRNDDIEFFLEGDKDG